jgi:hypothetical protein
MAGMDIEHTDVFLFQVPFTKKDLDRFRAPDSQPAVNPVNCGPVSGQLLGIITRALSNQLTVARRGMTLAEWEYEISNVLNSQVEGSIKSPADGPSYFLQKLFPGHATMVIYNRGGGQLGHAFVVAKTMEDRLYILDAQSREVYEDDKDYYRVLGGDPVNITVFLFTEPKTKSEIEKQQIDYLTKSMSELCIKGGTRKALRLKTIRKSHRKEKKFDAVFEKNGREIVTPFGQKGYSDFTKHKNVTRRARYLKRHRGMGEHWNKPTTPGSLARWVLWNKRTLRASVADFKRRFRL